MIERDELEIKGFETYTSAQSVLNSISETHSRGDPWQIVSFREIELWVQHLSCRTNELNSKRH